MVSKNFFRTGAMLGFLALPSSCGPVYLDGKYPDAILKGRNVTRSSEQIATFSFRLPTLDALGFVKFPLALQWTTRSNLDADYDFQICKENGEDCKTEFTLLCAGRYICGVRLSDGTQLSNFQITKNATRDRRADTFTLSMCNIGPSSIPSMAQIRIQPVVDGNPQTLVGGSASDVFTAGCLAN